MKHTSGSLNFFAHSPKELTNTCYTFDSTPYADPENLDGYSEDCPRIVCSALPVAFTNNTDNTKELIYAYTRAQNKADQGATGVTMTFKHPFARIYFKLAALHPNITINSITFKTLKNNGSCTFNGTTTTWTLTGSATDLVYSPGASFTTSPEAQPIGGPSSSFLKTGQVESRLMPLGQSGEKQRIIKRSLPQFLPTGSRATAILTPSLSLSSTSRWISPDSPSNGEKR